MSKVNGLIHGSPDGSKPLGQAISDCCCFVEFAALTNTADLNAEKLRCVVITVWIANCGAITYVLHKSKA